MIDKKKIKETEQQRIKQAGLNKCCLLMMIHGEDSLEFGELLKQVDKIATEFAKINVFFGND